MDTVKIASGLLAFSAAPQEAPAASPFGRIVLIVFGVLVALLFFFMLLDLIVKGGLSKKNIASKSLGRQIFGALIQWRLKSVLLFALLAVAMCGIVFVITPEHPVNMLWLTLQTLGVWLTIKVSRILSLPFSLRREEERITWSQIAILAAIGFWVIGFLIIFDTKDTPQVAAAVGLTGTLLGWIFQDKIKGVVAFLHLRLHHLLKVGDWIRVPAFKADGEVERITLTTVTIYNWDTTTSTIPISALHGDHFQNLQNMKEGKTYGRQMLKNFIFDTSCFAVLSPSEMERLCQEHEIGLYLGKDEIKEATLNARLFRLYLFHWLMNNKHVSQHPRLIVNWLEQTGEGMTLQVNAYITEGEWQPFEWQQSQIVEHIIQSARWFGMSLYQRPTAHAVSNGKVQLVDNQESARK